MSRPSSLTEEVESRLLKAVRAGTPQREAVRHAGVGERTFYTWMSRGEAEQARQDDGAPANPEEEPYRQFRQRVLRARADTAVGGVALIQSVARGGAVIRETKRRYRDPTSGEMVEETEVQRTAPDWRAAAWLLERSFRADFGRGPVEVTGPGGGPVQVSEPSLAELAARIRANVAELAPERPELLPGGEG